MRIVAFTGPKTSGKDTAAKYLLARNSILKSNLFEQHNFADAMKNTCANIFGFTPQEMNEMPFKEQELSRWPFHTPRYHMINIAKLFRTFYGGDVWVRAWERKIKISRAKCIVLTDLRHVEELEVLQKMQAVIIYVQNDKAEAELHRLREAGDMAANDVSEAAYELMRMSATTVLPNNGTIDELHSKMAEVALEHLGNWTIWGDEEVKL